MNTTPTPTKQHTLPGIVLSLGGDVVSSAPDGHRALLPSRQEPAHQVGSATTLENTSLSASALPSQQALELPDVACTSGGATSQGRPPLLSHQLPDLRDVNVSGDSAVAAPQQVLTRILDTSLSFENDPSIADPTSVSLETIRQSHREVIRLAFASHTHREIAEATGLSPQTVGNILRSPMAQAKLEQLQHKADQAAIDVRARIQNLAHDAVDVMEALLQERDARIRLSAAEGLLDRGGYGKTQRIESVSISALVSADDLAEINRRMDIVRSSGLIVDITPESDEVATM